MNKLIISISILLIVILTACNTNSIPQEKIDEFAQCLTENDVTMYGAFWCPHCAKSKAKFGSSFQYVTYVECDPRGDNAQAELCLEKEIENYDTWEFSDGTRVVGEPSFEELSEGSGCPVPGE